MKRSGLITLQAQDIVSTSFLSEIPFSKSLKALHFSDKVLTAKFLLTVMLKQWKHAVKKYKHSIFFEVF